MNNLKTFHPILIGLYFALYTIAVIFMFSQLDYVPKQPSFFFLKHVFPVGFSLPSYLLIIISITSLFFTGYFMHKIVTTQLEISRKQNLHFFLLPLIILQNHNIMEISMAVLFLALIMYTLSCALSISAPENSIKNIFLSGFLAGILLLISRIGLFFPFFFLFLLLSKRIFTFRAILIYGFAFILPLGYFFTWLYLIDFSSWSYFFYEEDLRLLIIEKISKQQNIYILIFLILFLTVLILRIHFKLSEYKISIRRAYNMILSTTLTLVAAIILLPKNHALIYLSALLVIGVFYYLRFLSDLNKRLFSAFAYMFPLLLFILNAVFIYFEINPF